MRFKCFSILILLSSTFVFGQTIKHKFLGLVENRDILLYVDQFDPSNNWSFSLKDIGQNNDIQLVGNNIVMVTFESGRGDYSGSKGGFIEFDLSQEGKIHRVCMDITPEGHETSCQRMPNGNTRLFRNNWNDKDPITCYEFDSTGKKMVKEPNSWEWKDDDNDACVGSRVVRQTESGTYLFGRTNTDKGYLCEGDTTGKILKEIPISGVGSGNNGSIYKAIRLENGNMIVSCGGARKTIEIKPDGSVVRTLNKDKLPNGSSIGMNFHSYFQILDNGNIVLCNWRGHGSTPNKRGQALFEYDTDGNVVWWWTDEDDVYSFHKIMILDNIDPQYLHYDIYGKLTPIDPPTGTPDLILSAKAPQTQYPGTLTMSSLAPFYIPAGVNGYEVYDLFGKKLLRTTGIYSKTVKRITLPASIGIQLVKVKLLK